MKSWKEFQIAQPVLIQIEEKYELLQQIEMTLTEVKESQPFSNEDIESTRDLILNALRIKAESISGQIYYWLYPFYEGNFLRLVAALGACGVMDVQKDDEESRLAFYQFFKTVPIDVRLKLGKKLNSPELEEQAEKIQSKMKTRKGKMKAYLDKYHSN